MAILLTGAGYIGATLLRRLGERGTDERAIVVLENFFSSTREQVLSAVPAGAVLIEGDVAEPGDVRRAFDELGDSPAVVYHLAAQPSAAIAARDPDLTERSNLVGARVVLEAAQARGARVVFGGSFRVYGDDLLGQTIDEATPYGRVGDLSHLSKIYVEHLARMLGVDFISVRLGVTYGLAPIIKTTPALMTVPNLFCQRAANGEVLQVLEDRPLAFIHVEDAADALLEAAEPAQRNAVVNAAPEVATIGQIARTVQDLMQQRGQWARIQGAAASEAGFKVTTSLRSVPRHTLADSLGDVLDFFLEHR